MILFIPPHAAHLLYNGVGFLTLKGDFYTCLPASHCHPHSHSERAAGARTRDESCALFNIAGITL